MDVLLMRTADLNIATAELDERISVGRGRERGDAALPTNNAASVGRERASTRSDARAAGSFPAAAVPSADLPQGRADAPRREHRTAA
jgi:hypothetical protein